MSEASRAAALQHAAAVHQGSGDPIATLETAEAFHTFISAASTPPAQTKAPVKAATKASTKATPTPTPKAEPEEAPEEDGITREQVGVAIEAMLNANLRPAAVKLFAKYGAKSLSGVKPEDYAAIKQDADDALLGA